MVFLSGLGKRNEQSKKPSRKTEVLDFKICADKYSLLEKAEHFFLKYVLRIPRIFQMLSRKQAESGGCFQVVSSAVYRLGF